MKHVAKRRLCSSLYDTLMLSIVVMILWSEQVQPLDGKVIKEELNLQQGVMNIRVLIIY